MVNPSTPKPADLIDVTPRAAQQAKALLAKKGIAEGALRLRVLAGGCSGMSYDIQPFEGPPPSNDFTVEAHGLKLYIEPKSVLYLAGTQLDYEQSLMSQRFVFRNPNAKSSCSCGESFGV